MALTISEVICNVMALFSKKGQSMPRKNSKHHEPSPEAEITPPQEMQDGGKVAFQIRFEAELHRKLKAAADQSGMSLNQLLQGICSACVENIHMGEPNFHPDGYVLSRPVRKCVYFGYRGYSLTDEELRDIQTSVDEPDSVARVSQGKIWFSLDYSERNFKTY
jgi:predicted HicB family RNase H-like nuclease